MSDSKNERALPSTDDILDDDVSLDMPDAEDVDHPAIERARDRIRNRQEEAAEGGHQKHTSHDKTGHDSSVW